MAHLDGHGNEDAEKLIRLTKRKGDAAADLVSGRGALLIPDPDELRPSGSGINSLPSRAARLPLAFARVRACARGAG
jgi:hypothetical protein